MCEDREKDLASHRPQPEANRAHAAEDGREDAKTQLAIALKHGCHHRELYGPSGSNKLNVRMCLCLQMHRVSGTAIIDELWAHRTRRMREGWETLPETSEVFRWHHCPCLERVEVVPDCLREVVFNLWGEHGRCGSTSVDDTSPVRLGHICSVETAQKIQADTAGLLKLSEDFRALKGRTSREHMSREGWAIGWETTETEEVAQALALAGSMEGKLSRPITTGLAPKLMDLFAKVGPSFRNSFPCFLPCFLPYFLP
jgi:hypothetical protein